MLEERRNRAGKNLGYVWSRRAVGWLRQDAPAQSVLSKASILSQHMCIKCLLSGRQVKQQKIFNTVRVIFLCTLARKAYWTSQRNFVYSTTAMVCATVLRKKIDRVNAYKNASEALGQFKLETLKSAFEKFAIFIAQNINKQQPDMNSKCLRPIFCIIFSTIVSIVYDSCFRCLVFSLYQK